MLELNAFFIFPGITEGIAEPRLFPIEWCSTLVAYSFYVNNIL